MPVERTAIKFELDEGTPESLRFAVLTKWSQEKRGSATAFQRYRYDVETFANGGTIYLHRPAFKNKGCDFVVHCEPQIQRDDGKKIKSPRHSDLIAELVELAKQVPSGQALLLSSIEEVWNCKSVANICKSLHQSFATPELMMRTERALKVAKWLFIEQDITDWNTSGRDMLMNGIRRHLDVSRA